jgi:hypothetical protein
MAAYAAPVFNALTFYGMQSIVAVVLPAAAWVFAGGSAKAWRGWLLVMLAFAALAAGLAANGLLARSDLHPPPLQMLAIAAQAGLLWFGLSAMGRSAARRGSVAALVLLQAFRLPLELLMLHAANVGVMPVEFSAAGYNLDIVTGALALPLGVALALQWRVPQALLWAWNLWGIACLLGIVTLAVATSPNVAFFGAGDAHLSLWILHFPYAWLPLVLVSVAVYGHLAMSVKLLAKRGQ